MDERPLNLIMASSMAFPVRLVALSWKEFFRDLMKGLTFARRSYSGSPRDAMVLLSTKCRNLWISKSIP